MSLRIDEGRTARTSLLESGRFRLIAIVFMSALLLSIESSVARTPTLRTDVASLIIVYLALEFEMKTGLLMALAVGYVADVFSGEPRGLYVGSLVVVFLLLRLAIIRVAGSGWLLVTISGIIATLFAAFVRLTIDAVIGTGQSTIVGMIPSLPALLLGAIILGYPVNRLLGRINERFKGTAETFR